MGLVFLRGVGSSVESKALSRVSLPISCPSQMLPCSDGQGQAWLEGNLESSGKGRVEAWLRIMTPPRWPWRKRRGAFYGSFPAHTPRPAAREEGLVPTLAHLS